MPMYFSVGESGWIQKGSRGSGWREDRANCFVIDPQPEYIALVFVVTCRMDPPPLNTNYLNWPRRNAIVTRIVLDVGEPAAVLPCCIAAGCSSEKHQSKTNLRYIFSIGLSCRDFLRLSTLRQVRLVPPVREPVLMKASLCVRSLTPGLCGAGSRDVTLTCRAQDPPQHPPVHTPDERRDNGAKRKRGKKKKYRGRAFVSE